MAKRISISSADWKIIIDGYMGQKTAALALKSKSDKFVRMVASHPSEFPKIDWKYYESKISVPGMVDSFKKNYEAIKLPYPTDQGFFSQIDKEEQTYSNIAQKHEENKLKGLENLKAILANLEKQLPFSEMHIEEFLLARPEYQFDPENPKPFPQFK